MRHRVLIWWGLALALAVPLAAQQPTLARLSRESTEPHVPHTASYGAPRDSATSRHAAHELFVTGDLVRARQLAARALRGNPQDAEALFVRMELAAIDDDRAAGLDSAVRLCEAGAGTPGDPRVRLAAFRVRESAANTPEFRRALSRVQSLVANAGGAGWDDLQRAVLDAALAGVPGLDPYAAARASGIVTDWRIVGPLGSHALIDFDRELIRTNDNLSEAQYGNRAVENFQFPDGFIRLPDYLSSRGVFYAAGAMPVLTSVTWQLRLESGGPAELYLDGRSVLRTTARDANGTAVAEVAPGPHRFLVKFVGSVAPLRVSVSRVNEPTPTRPQASPAEAVYLRAAAGLAVGDAAAAIHEIDSTSAAPNSAALQFLLAQCSDALSGARNKPTNEDVEIARAQSLAREGNHAEAARKLERLLFGAPLNRTAQFLLVRELQLAGDDAGAQRAAAEWLRIAPNAESYRRLAAAGSRVEPGSSSVEFYAPYRRDAAALVSQMPADTTGSSVVLLDDHVALARADGSVSLYVHTATRVKDGDDVSATQIPRDAQVLTSRTVAGGILDVEYVLNFAGDGGMPEHAEAFQYVFGNFQQPVMNARFVVLTAAGRGDGGVVIATGHAPQCVSDVRDGMLERTWETRFNAEGGSANMLPDLSIVRVVEEDNGWSVPRNAERQRRIETIHPGPRSVES
jgi:hypothetical protein